MCYTQSEKMEIIHLEERSELPVKHTLEGLGVALGTFDSKSSMDRILKDYKQLSSPAFEVVSASDSFRNLTKRVHEPWSIICKMVNQ